MFSHSKLIGHNSVFHNLVELNNNHKLPNIIMLTGKKGIGKFLLANHFINYIYTKDENNEYDLNNFRINSLNKNSILIEKNSHPNIFKIYKKSDKKNIEILQIREMIKFQNYSSLNNKKKFVIIDAIEDLNINSTNALLKSIEEPNNDMFFILINNYEKRVTDTLKSRCIEFKLFLKNKDIKTIVDNYFNENIYDQISNDFKNFYSTPSFLIFFIVFLKENRINLVNLSINDLICELIKNKHYSKNQFIKDNVNYFIELFFYKNINLSKNISYKIKEYFYLKLSEVKKYNLDLETFFLEFEDKLLSE